MDKLEYKITMKSLYAYFGLLDLHTIDSPGHSLYQLGLIDSIRESFGDVKFDFYSYYPDEIIKLTNRNPYPEDSRIGVIFNDYQKRLIEYQHFEVSQVLRRIQIKEYDRLYLKARFRNLSTLSKKWKDAKEFEEIIKVAIESGYTKDEIIILDTDLSLPEIFYTRYESLVTIKIPSIDFPGISNGFLEKCVQAHLKDYKKHPNSIVYYGNIDTSAYKEGNSKSLILQDILNYLANDSKEDNIDFSVIAKQSDLNPFPPSVNGVLRHEREKIWYTLLSKVAMLNITKDKYNDRKFIPARIYEAMIFGMIPVSYKFSFLSPAFSFESIEDFKEILKYLEDCETSDLVNAYSHFIQSYFKYVRSCNFQISN